MADADVDSYLSRYGQEFQRLSYESALAEWESNTRIVERDSTNSVPPEAQVVPADRFNRKWWELARQYQGIVPPSPRGERWADGLTKTHVNDDPAQYYDYALSYVLLFQLHDHIARQILHQNPHDTDYYGHREVGDFLKRLMAPGATRPWREVLRETTGRELDGKAMVEYFQPLYIWLQQQNRGRRATLPDL